MEGQAHFDSDEDAKPTKKRKAAPSRTKAKKKDASNKDGDVERGSVDNREGGTPEDTVMMDLTGPRTTRKTVKKAQKTLKANAAVLTDKPITFDSADDDDDTPPAKRPRNAARPKPRPVTKTGARNPPRGDQDMEEAPSAKASDILPPSPGLPLLPTRPATLPPSLPPARASSSPPPARPASPLRLARSPPRNGTPPSNHSTPRQQRSGDLMDHEPQAYGSPGVDGVGMEEEDVDMEGDTGMEGDVGMKEVVVMEQNAGMEKDAGMEEDDGAEGDVSDGGVEMANDTNDDTQRTPTLARRGRRAAIADPQSPTPRNFSDGGSVPEGSQVHHARLAHQNSSAAIDLNRLSLAPEESRRELYPPQEPAQTARSSPLSSPPASLPTQQASRSRSEAEVSRGLFEDRTFGSSSDERGLHDSDDGSGGFHLH